MYVLTQLARNLNGRRSYTRGSGAVVARSCAEQRLNPVNQR